MRGDGVLNTGVTSQSFAPKVDPARVEKREKRAELRLKLLPAGEIVNEEVKKEINALMYGPYSDEDKMSDAQFRAERRGRKLAVAALMSFQTRLNIMLRDRSEEASSE